MRQVGDGGLVKVRRSRTDWVPLAVSLCLACGGNGGGSTTATGGRAGGGGGMSGAGGKAGAGGVSGAGGVGGKSGASGASGGGGKGGAGAGGAGGAAGGAPPPTDGGLDRHTDASADAHKQATDAHPKSDGGVDGSADGGCSLGPVLCQEEPAVPGQWYELANSATGPGVALGSTECDAPTLTLDAQTNPLVVWSGAIAQTAGLRFRHWTGTAWDDLGGSDSMSVPVCHDTGTSGESVGIYSDGSPLVLCPDQPADVRHWNGTAWVGLASQGTVSEVPGPYALARNVNVTLAMGPDGNPVVAWGYQTALPSQSYYLELEQWTGSAWQALGNSASTTGLAMGSWAKVAVDLDGHPYVAYYNGLQHWNGTSWDVIDLPVAPANTTLYGIASLVVLPDGRLAIAEGAANLPMPAGQTVPNTDGRVYVRDGGQWIGLGGSDQFGGVTGSSHASVGMMAVDERGRLSVAWIEGVGGVGVIKLRRWDGHGWQQLGNSASAVGVPQTTAGCSLGAVAVRGTRTCVVWLESVGMVHLRCFTDPA
jgi:hypothetical protein